MKSTITKTQALAIDSAAAHLRCAGFSGFKAHCTDSLHVLTEVCIRADGTVWVKKEGCGTSYYGDTNQLIKESI